NTKATGHLPQHPPALVQENARPSAANSASSAQRRSNRSSTANSWWQQNQDRRAASATTNAPAARFEEMRVGDLPGHRVVLDRPPAWLRGTELIEQAGKGDLALHSGEAFRGGQRRSTGRRSWGSWR